MMVAESVWLPRSGCGPRCLPAPGAVPAASAVRVAGRLLALAVIVATALLAAPLVLWSGSRTPARSGRLLARLLLRVLGVHHHSHGHLPRRSTLVVANHVSWLDVLVLTAYLPAVRLVAKREVRDWPVIGVLARVAGTLFIDRTRPRTLPVTVAQVRTALGGGSVVALFPEGTTWCGNDGGRFRPALFQAAIDAGAAIAPVTLRFGLPDGTATTVAAFIGDDHLMASIRRVVSARAIHVDLRLHPALYPGPDASRRALADATQASISGWAPHR